MHDVAARKNELRGKIDVTSITLARLPLISMLMIRQALRHRRPHRLLLELAGHGVAADALSAELRHVRVVPEAQVLARETILFARVRLAVTRSARSRVVWLLMTADARARVGDVERAGITGTGDTLVALEAADPFDRMGSMLERVLFASRLDAEDSSASGEQERQAEEKRELHGCLRSNAYESRARA